MLKKDFKKFALCLSAVFLFSTDFLLPVSAEMAGVGAAPKEQSLEHPQDEINVHAERNDKNCPITIHQGKILGASHGTHTKYLPSVNIPYRENFTFFSVADGEKTYLVRRQGSLHVKDFVGVIVSAPCRESVAEVVKIGELSSANTD
ncbi:hypothetical protein FAI41_01260 [Acetobacteraceae bacterium]|nr:hypothetical protein FAI41_01260 [Acetobacteraceae bacterium]